MSEHRPLIRPDAQLLPTLLDQLRDAASQRQMEAVNEYTVTCTQIREIPQRDLAYPLNTTNRENEIDRTRYPEAASSTINYGVPPVVGSYLSEHKWTDIVKIVRRAILDSEPRLIPGSLEAKSLFKEDAPTRYNVLLFEIGGLIHMDPYPMAFTAQSSLDLETGHTNVRSLHVH